MSGTKVPIHQGAQFARGYYGQIGAIAEDAGRVDEAGKWGVDGWIRLIHNLIDLQIRTSATVLQAALAGPWWLQPIDREPWLSDEIAVPIPQDYPQYFTIVKPFDRIGRRDTRIPDPAITFVPAILPAGARTFKIDLTDNNFVGANYVGVITLRPMDSSKESRRKAQTFSVTVGL
ncbi:hypothetical protein BH09ACT8_BH09ACT8_24920 [soil metagenome]